MNQSNMKIKLLLPVILLTVLIASCDDDAEDDKTPVVINTTGVFVVNEGSFGSGNGSVSFLNVNTNVMTNNVFETVNGFPLGDVAQSMTLHQNKGYIVVNNSQKIEVVDGTTFASIQTINGFQSPRHFVGVGAKGYVCDWTSNTVKVLNLATNTITGSIPAGNGPEQALVSGTKLFVVNVGGFGMDSTVTVIDLLTDGVIATLHVGVNPNSIVADGSGKLWVLCGGSTGPDYIGGTADDIAGSLWKINPFDYDIEQQFTMGQFDHPVKLKIDNTGGNLFYLLGYDGYTGKVIKMAAFPGQLTNVPFVNKSFYGLGIDKTSGIIYGGYVPGFSQNGYVFRYTTSGALMDSLEVGVAPNGFVFQTN